jgi:malonyl-CoA/methylmalonyl-CoA synthetase
VIGLPHADFGEGVAAVVVCHGAGVTAEAVQAHCRAHLAAFKAPKAVVVVEALPRNAMGKVEKAKLRQAYSDLFAR